jgi:hypothetical protein
MAKLGSSVILRKGIPQFGFGSGTATLVRPRLSYYTLFSIFFKVVPVTKPSYRSKKANKSTRKVGRGAISEPILSKTLYLVGGRDLLALVAHKADLFPHVTVHRALRMRKHGYCHT